MRWRIDDHGRLVITASKREQQSLQAAQRRDQRGQCDPAFDSDAFMHDLLEPITTDSELAWLSEGCTDDLTSAPMLALLGSEMPGPDDLQDASGMGLVHVGRWTHEGRLRQMYQPVLKRWAFMSYAVTSPQRDLADSGVCIWEGGELWGTDDVAVKALSKFEAQEIGSGE
jgi:hypothetical protein